MIKEGDIVLLLGKRRIIVKAKQGLSKVGKGTADLSKILGMEYGDTVKFWGEEFRVYRASMEDMLENFERGPQVILPKDSSVIVHLCDLKSGDMVLEAGIGSGWLTATLVRAVIPEGKVISYDINKNSIYIARKNLEKAGLPEYVEMREGDIRTAAPGMKFSSFVLDIPDPWNALETVKNALLHGGNLCVYVPTYNQLENMAVSMKNDFFDIKASETIRREIDVKKEATRPRFTGLMHTGFILHGRKK